MVLKIPITQSDFKKSSMAHLDDTILLANSNFDSLKMIYFFKVVNDEPTSSKLYRPTEWIKKKARSACTKKMLYRRLPILDWLPKYNGAAALGDLVAGITVGLTVIPQSLAYSNVAGLPTEVRT